MKENVDADRTGGLLSVMSSSSFTLINALRSSLKNTFLQSHLLLIKNFFSHLAQAFGYFTFYYLYFLSYFAFYQQLSRHNIWAAKHSNKVN